MKASIAAATRSADAAQAGTRPWITAEFEVVLLSRSEAGVNIVMHVTLKNIGHSPAQYVFLSPRVVFYDYENGIKTQREVCEDSIKAWDNIRRSDNIIFPSDAQLTNSTGIIRMKDVIDWQDRRIARGLQRKNPMDEREAESERKFTVFGVVGCISYGFAGSPNIHQTGFILTLTNAPKQPGGAAAPTLIDITKDGEFPVGNLLLVQDLYGSFAN